MLQRDSDVRSSVANTSVSWLNVTMARHGETHAILSLPGASEPSSLVSMVYAVSALISNHLGSVKMSHRIEASNDGLQVVTGGCRPEFRWIV